MSAAEDYPILARVSTRGGEAGAEASRALAEIQNLRTDVANLLTRLAVETGSR